MKKQTKNSQQTPSKAAGEKQKQGKNEEFPGYPLYPAGEDIMNQGNRIDLDLDGTIANSQLDKGISVPQIKWLASDSTTDEPSDLTKDDFQALASEELESTGDDEILLNRPWPVDFAGNDLDIPGSEQDDAQEEVGSEDEENNAYSIGGDRHTDLEEDRS